MVRLTLKNYRCFSDQHPVTIEFAPGFTAFVGANNSGKSAFLRFIYEYQQLWGHLRNPSYLPQFEKKPQQNTPIDIGRLRGVVDLDEVVCDFTRRPLAITLALTAPPSTSHLKSVSMVALERPSLLRGSLELGPGPRHIGNVSGSNVTDNHNEAVFWTPYLDTFATFQSSMFAPAFRNAINEGSGSYFDLSVGTSVVAQWNQWKAGNSRAAKLAIQDITEDIRHIFGFRTLEINSSADDKTFEVVVDGRPFRLHDLGAGLSQFIILFVNAAVKKPTLLLIDEPELNLHPRLQVDFLTALASYTSTGSVIFATHSLGLARAVADRIYTFSSTPTGTIVTPFERTPNYAQFAGEMGFGGYQELGFSTVLMVEGPSEIRAVQQFLRLLGHDHDVVILHLGGSSMIAPGRQIELAELRRISSSIAILIDSEKRDVNASIAADRATFIDDCTKLGFLTHVTNLRAFENYLTDRAVKAVKGPTYRALSPYELLADATPSWRKQDNWRIARQMTLAELMATDVGEFLALVTNLAVAKT